jgi:hypothetical protein
LFVVNPCNCDATLANLEAITCIPIIAVLWGILVHVEARFISGHRDTAVLEWISYPTHEGKVLTHSNGWIPWKNIDGNTTGAICNKERKTLHDF